MPKEDIFFVADPSIRKIYPDTWDGFNYAPYVTNEPNMDMTIIIKSKFSRIICYERIDFNIEKICFQR